MSVVVTRNFPLFFRILSIMSVVAKLVDKPGILNLIKVINIDSCYLLRVMWIRKRIIGDLLYTVPGSKKIAENAPKVSKTGRRKN